MDTLKRLTLTFLLGIFLVSLASAQTGNQGCAPQGFMGEFQKDSNITLTIVCPTCTFLNFSLKDPKGAINLSNQNMSLTGGSFQFGPNHSITGITGTWFLEGHSNLDLPVKSCYVITDILKDITTGQAIIFTILIIFFSLLIVGGIYYSIEIPFSNKEYKGVVIPTKKKYLKMGFIVLSYAMITLVLNLFFILSKNYIGATAFTAGIQLMFSIFVRVARPFFVVMFVLAIYHLIKDFNFGQVGKRVIKNLEESLK